MQLVPYNVLLDGLSEALGWDVGELSSVEFGAAKRAFGLALQEIWESSWWKDLMLTERRAMRDAYDSTMPYVAGEEVWHPGSNQYYAALRDTTGNAPATSTGSGAWTTNVAYWSECVRDPQAEDYSATKAYAAGDQVRDADSDLVYQCHTATTGHAPTDAAYWGPVNPFEPRIPFVQAGFTTIGTVRGVYRQDPRKFTGAPSLQWDLDASGVELFDLDIARPWVVYRQRCPQVELGDVYDPTKGYAPSDDDEGSIPQPVVAKGDYAGFDSIGQAQAAEILARRVDVKADGNGRPGSFWVDETYSGANDGVAGFYDAVGTPFVRISRE